MMEVERTIEDWCVYLDISNYEIDMDGVVNVMNDLIMSKRNFGIIPIQFGIVTGDFYCNNNKLETLEGGPRKVGRFFCASVNKLTSLKGGPREVGGSYYCHNNKLISLEGGPREVGGDFQCIGNPIWKDFIKYNSYTKYMRTIKLKEIL